MVHKIMSSLASCRDKADDGAIIASVSYKTATEDVCASDHLTESTVSMLPVLMSSAYNYENFTQRAWFL